MRILLIEDDPVVAQSIALMLSPDPFEVEATSLGESGLDLGRLERHDLILLDLNLQTYPASRFFGRYAFVGSKRRS